MKKLTIGSAVYDDYEGVYFSYQSLRLNNMDIDDDIDYVIIDNNPDSAEGKAVKKFCQDSQKIRYFPFKDKISNSIKNKIFEHAEGRFCLSIDCHILFEPNSIKRLIDFFSHHPESDDLYHGPMLYDQLLNHGPVTHMDPEWRGNMFGTWACDKRGEDSAAPPFEIPMHGCGIFAARTEGWLGFNEQFSGFGGEEGYIHEKYKQQGNKIWCLPFLRWIHRFNRPRGVPYPLIIEDRIKNYLIGHEELGLPLDDLIAHFNETQSHIDIQKLIEDLEEPPAPTSAPKPPLPPKDGERVKLWENSVIDFATPASFRYIEYEILDSYDGLASLRHVAIEPPHPPEASVKSFSSESPEGPARALLDDSDSYWLTPETTKNQFPQKVIIDLGAPTQIQKITTLARAGCWPGLPTEFKVYGSNNLKDRQELSHVNILSADNL